MEYNLKGGVLKFKEFDPKEKNLVKVNINTDGKPNGEGCWMCISDSDLIDHNNDVLDVKPTRVGILRNNSLHFAAPSWGIYIHYRLNGENRPVCNLSLLIKKWKPKFNTKDTISRMV